MNEKIAELEYMISMQSEKKHKTKFKHVGVYFFLFLYHIRQHTRNSTNHFQKHIYNGRSNIKFQPIKCPQQRLLLSMSANWTIQISTSEKKNSVKAGTNIHYIILYQSQVKVVPVIKCSASIIYISTQSYCNRPTINSNNQWIILIMC